MSEWGGASGGFDFCFLLFCGFWGKSDFGKDI